MAMRNSFAVHFVLQYSKIVLELTNCSKILPNISLTKYDNKNMSSWLTKVNLLKLYIQVTFFL